MPGVRASSSLDLDISEQLEARVFRYLLPALMKESKDDAGLLVSAISTNLSLN